MLWHKSTSDTSFPPIVADIQHYDDETILVQIIRRNSTPVADCSKVNGVNLEQILRIRVIHPNATVNEINLDLNYLNINPINYCLYNDHFTHLNPIRIYPLQKPFVLLNYMSTTNSSDPTTYEEWGEVIDWNGIIKSNISFGPSYGTMSVIQLNIDKTLGFLRFATVKKDNMTWTKWQQYSVDPSGKLSNLTSANLTLRDFSNYSMPIISTVDGGYAIFHTYNSYDNNSNLLLSRGGLSVTFVSYNQSQTAPSREMVLYQITQPNMRAGSVSCDTVNALTFGNNHTCIMSISNLNNTETYYVKINFLLSGAVLSSNIIPLDFHNVALSNITSPDFNLTFKQGWSVQSMPSGGYTLHRASKNAHYIYAYGEDNNPIPIHTNSFLTNSFGANAVINNNTFLLASSDTNFQNTSWSLITIQLPKVLKNYDYGCRNLLISKTTPSLNDSVNSDTHMLYITFFDAIILSTGYVTIYKTSDNSIRQRISATMNEFINIDSKGTTISISVIGSTFNQYGEEYYVKVDYNFVKSAMNNEPIKGIEGRIWRLKSNNSINDDKQRPSETYVDGLATFTIDASKKIAVFSIIERDNYYKDLLNEITAKVSVGLGRLDYMEDLSNSSFSIIIYPIYDKTENTVLGVVSDLNNMIVYKQITTFSTGLTNDLNSTTGFQRINESELMTAFYMLMEFNHTTNFPIIGIGTWWSLFINAAIIFVTGLFAISLLFHILSIYILHSKKFEAISSAILRLTLIIPNFIILLLFIVYIPKIDPIVYLPSVLLFSILLLVNFCIAIYSVYNGIIKHPVFKEWVARRKVLVALLTILAATDYEYLYILKDGPRFSEVAIDYKYLTIMKDDPESNEAKTYYEYLKILKYELGSDEIKQIKLINIFRQIFKFPIIFETFFETFSGLLY
ncbi:hypothetical protein F8M41_010121 [Gigaspora margarita]|uniref:Uncharacterized protein n=1 Tax=Gigaspora margarita TaxID=4874 RepID=A0A8H4A190_GIGMA|nr:hypothetical protein F8M41_010121 [Gigaspora margarita]